MEVVVYSRAHCIECNVLKMFLRDQGISFETRDCSSQPEWMDEVEKLGFQSVPITVVNGKAVQGFRESELRELLASASA